MKKRVLFVGAFKKTGKDGNIGGQMYASQSLISSTLNKDIEWVLIDSTADSNITRSFFNRAGNAMKRLLLFSYHILFSKIDKVLIFTAHRFSFVEKGGMVMIAKMLGKEAVLAPRSGIIVKDIEHSAFMRYYIPLVLKKADVVICQGVRWKTFYYNLLGSDEEKFVIIQNWLDITKYFPSNKSIDKPEINVLFLSWVDENKGILDLIKAAANLKLQFSHVKYHIAGDGTAMSASQAMVKEKGLGNQFIFHGWVNGKEKQDLLAMSNVYVLPSYFEGLPNSLLEAMASGLTVITTDVGVIPDVVQDGYNGYLFSKGEVEALSQKLKLTFENPQKSKKLAANARRTILENNTLEVSIPKFKQLFQISSLN